MRFFLPAVDWLIPVHDEPLDSLAAGRSCYRDECGGHIGAQVHLPRSHPKISESAVKGCYLEGTVNWNFSKKEMKKFFCLCAILTLLPVFLLGCRRLEFDNVTPYENKIPAPIQKKKLTGWLTRSRHREVGSETEGYHRFFELMDDYAENICPE